ncbi:MAG: protein kinase [Gemmatimonadaceae bacterium]|nr:protein kinase [Gemmatimonadaceae bacterium]
MIDDTLRSALADRYRVERELGAGGMATVYLAEDLKHRRKVALKLLRPELTALLGPERFLQEIALTASLQHPHILPLFDSGSIDGQLFYVMPYVDGETLRQRIARGPIPMDEALDILRDVARALTYAHAQGVVHRDIKPDNVLLSSGTAVVSDFGIAKALSASREPDEPASFTLTRAGTSLGTPAYMSPEQAIGDVVDARTDVYAFGVIAYELLAGAHPFASHSTTQRLIAAQLSEMPPPLATKNPSVPSAVSTLIMHCLAKDPSARPANGGELLARLSAASTKVIPRARHWPLVAAAALFVVALSAIFISRRGTEPASARSIVVVPFDNLGNPSDAYFAEGMSDEIADQLARLPGLQVIGREGVKRFGGSQKSPRDIARELGAAFVLSGTVRWARQATGSGELNGATRVRIVPILLNVASGTQAWGQPYEEPLTDVFKVQASVAERVATALSVTLGDTARAALHHEESTNPDARDAQLLGRFLLRQRGLSNLRQAADAFQRAIARDSNYARAWAGLSEATGLIPGYRDTVLDDSAYRARAGWAAQRALALDSTLPEVQIALARALATDFRFREALPRVQRAIALDPNATLAYALENEILTALGRTADADSAIRRAFALDSLSPLVLNLTSTAYAAAGKYDSAIHYSERAVSISPEVNLWKRSLSMSYALAGRFEDAVRVCEATGQSPARCTGVYGAFSADPARRAAAAEQLGEMGRLPGVTGAPGYTALAYAGLGMADSVFARLAVAVERRDDVLEHTVTAGLFEPYHKDPRWDKIVGAMQRR